MRVATSLKRQDDTRAIGTLFGTRHPAYAKLLAGPIYVGGATLFGTRYMMSMRRSRIASGA